MDGILDGSPDAIAAMPRAIQPTESASMNVQSRPGLLFRARNALGMSREEVGRAMGVSFRTVVRWEGGHTMVDGPSFLELVPRLYPIDAKLAGEIAIACGARLAEMGLGPEAEAAAAITPPLLVDSVVCAAADALECAPAAARRAVLAAFRRARELRMTVDAVEKALAPPPARDASAPAPKKGKAKA
jgi:transcriptional regulator with XRE-family HTH domain